MDGLSFAWNSPWFLVLLAVLPFLWWVGRESLSGLGRARARVSFALRALVVVVLLLALAEIELRQCGRGVSVIYLLDQSLSVPAADREAMFQYVARAAAAHRVPARGDRVGVIVFGREAAVEVPPVEDSLAWLRQSETLVPRLAEATNLAAALKLALLVLPRDGARRVVLVSDGNENVGAVREIAPQLAAQGVGIDVVPVSLTRPRDVIVEKITLPATFQQGEPIEARVVIVHDVAPTTASSPDTVSGRLRVLGRVGADTRILVEQDVELMPGKNVFPLVQRIDTQPGFYACEAEFIPHPGTVERTRENNRATAFSHVRGRGRVLFIENVAEPGEFDFLVERLKAAAIDVDVRTSDQSFRSLAELQSYDVVVLANVARTSNVGDTLFSDSQIEMLVRNTETGCGLVLLGGPDSYGAGGWEETPLEEASPVKFTIEQAEVIPSGALVLVIDKSASMQGEKMAMSRQAAIEAVRLLGAKDHIAIVAFDGETRWVVPMQQVGTRREDIVRSIRTLRADGGTTMFPAMREGFLAVQGVDAAVKHMIVLTDGRTEGAEFLELVSGMRESRVTVSAVSVGGDADSQLLADIARQGGGNFYRVNTPQAIPRVFVKEATRVVKPLVYENEEGVAPHVIFPHEMLRGIEGPFPPLTGFVLTELKDNPLVEVALRSPDPGDAQTSTLLASWTYGLGRSVVWTTDAGRRWTTAWTRWEHYGLLFEQMVRWAMRPRDRDDRFLVAAELKDGGIRAVVTALDEDREFVNLLDVSCLVTMPDLQLREMPMQQTAPGRYVGELPAVEPGNYFLTIHPGRDRAVLRAGVHVPSAVEFEDRQTNWPLLRTLAAQAPVGGEPGVVGQEQLHAGAAALPTLDAFRPTLAAAFTTRDIWPSLLMLAAFLFLLDVFTRRVALNPLALAEPVVRWWRNRAETQPRQQRLQQLQQRKAALDRHFEQRRAAGRLELPADQSAAASELPAAAPGAADATNTSRVDASREGDEDDAPSYTSRLLEAKRRARQHYLPPGDEPTRR